MMPRIPQTGAYLAFGKEAIEDALSGGLWPEGLREEAMAAMEGGSILSSAFVVWKEGEQSDKGRLVIVFFGTVDPLAEGQRADGWCTGVRVVHDEKRSNDFDGREEGLSPFAASPVDATVVLVRIRRAILQLHRATLRLRAV